MTNYTLGVIIADDISVRDIVKSYKHSLLCAVRYNLNDSLNLRVSLQEIPKKEFSPRRILEAVCKLNDSISTIVLILPQSNDYSYLPSYKYIVNHISSLGIPLIVWNSYMPKVSLLPKF